MNILLFTAEPALTTVALCVVHGETQCTLAGEVTQDAAALHIALRDPQGQQLYRADVPCPANAGASHEGAVQAVLGWLLERNIRVDLVVHRIAHHGDHDHVLRLLPDRVSLLAEFPACEDAVYCIDAVTALAPSLPQAAFFAVRPHTAESMAAAIAGSDVRAPAGCMKKMKVRCTSCCAE